MTEEMERSEENSGYLPQRYGGKSSQDSFEEAIIIVAFIGVTTFILGLLAANIFTVEQMYIIRPALVACAVFIVFCYILGSRVGTYLIGDIGFIYLGISLAYTIFPAIKFLMIDLNFPVDFDAINFAVLSPQPVDLGRHFWRHMLFISGVATGYLAVRGRSVPLKALEAEADRRYGRIIAIFIIIMVTCICIVTSLSTLPTRYVEHYIRFDHLSWPLRQFVNLCLMFKSGGYFVLMGLIFSQYRRYKILIFIFVPIFCAYEIIYSLGSRIVAFAILLAVLGFYHFRVNPISLKKGIAFLIILAFIFSGIAIIRSASYGLENYDNTMQENEIRASEFEAVYCTSFHLYAERGQHTLPPRDWQMFFYEFISVIPFIDHKKYHPQYWYARNYFPEAIVPLTTMGVIADSAIWGGEFDLISRSLINGAIFALLMRWFLRRREKWWALIVYIYCYATCIMVLKYSVLFQIIPLFQVLIPLLLLTGILFRMQKNTARS